MTAKLLDGESLAKRLVAQLVPRVTAVAEERGAPPLLAILSVGDNFSSRLYMKKKLAACQEAGIETSVQSVPESISEVETLKLLSDMAKNESVDGIIVETPLPKRLSLQRILEHLPPAKDVEGLTAENYGRLFSAKNLAEMAAGGVLIPPTPHSILQLLFESHAPVNGTEAVVVGRSTIVGKPIAHLLSALDATVTLCHSKTRDLNAHLRRADIVVSAVGQPRFIRGEDIKPGAVVLDAGINYEEGKLCGDVDTKTAREVAGHLAAVPGGVGPVTVAMLLTNVVIAAERRFPH